MPRKHKRLMDRLGEPTVVLICQLRAHRSVQEPGFDVRIEIVLKTALAKRKLAKHL
jgi:hypothetical protein